MSFRQSLSLASVLIVSLATAGLVRAAAPKVLDEGQFFSQDSIAKADRKIEDIYKESGKELQIETVPYVPADMQAKLGELGSKEFFRGWTQRRAEDARSKGIYVLVCKNPGHIEILIDRETRKKAFTLNDRDRLAAKLLDLLGDKKYDAALQDTVETVQSTIRTNLGLKHVDSPDPSSKPAESTPAAKPAESKTPTKPADSPTPSKPADDAAPRSDISDKPAT